MQANLPISKPKDKKNSSRVIPRPDNLEGGEETEIAAQVSLPNEGGWGWFVVVCAMGCTTILDGIVFTFGSLLSDMTEDLQQSEALVVLINSIAIALYFILSPVTSALINRFGFRTCAMTGSVLCSMSLLITHFATNYLTIVIFYGMIAGLGYSLINLSSILVVGFYFEKYRAFALTLATVGSSIGVTCMFPLNVFLIPIGGWRVVTLLHSGMFGLIYFFAMSFKPLLSLAVVHASDDPTRTVTYLPTLSTVTVQQTRSKSEAIVPTATERLFVAASNYNFPTAAQMVDDNQNNAGPSTRAAHSKLALKVLNTERTISTRQLRQMKSAISNMSLQESHKDIEATNNSEPIKKGCCGRLCTWESHVDEERPLYRDDAFYDGKIQKLPEYEKSKMNTTGDLDAGIEYRLAVTRAAAATDLKDKRGIFTIAARRILATMMDTKLLRRASFLSLCFHGFFLYLGLLVPYVYLKERNLREGIPLKHCTWFVSVIGFCNIVGRLILGFLAYKLDPLYLMSASVICAGCSTCISMLSFSLYYQYLYCFVFGLFIASAATLRSMVIVSLYGLEKLTNATGMMLVFQGVGSLLSTPMASAIKSTSGFTLAFIISGASITLSGVILWPAKFFKRAEDKRNNDK